MIHQYKLGGYNIVLDVCSGSVHVVDDVAYDIIAMFEEKDRDVILAAMAEKYEKKMQVVKENIALDQAEAAAASAAPTEPEMLS